MRVMRNSRACGLRAGGDGARLATRRSASPPPAHGGGGLKRCAATGSSFYDAGDTMMRGTCAAGVHAEGGLSGAKPVRAGRIATLNRIQ